MCCGCSSANRSAASLPTAPRSPGTPRVVRRPHSSAAPGITPGQTVGPPWPHRQRRTGMPGMARDGCRAHGRRPRLELAEHTATAGGLAVRRPRAKAQVTRCRHGGGTVRPPQHDDARAPFLSRRARGKQSEPPTPKMGTLIGGQTTTCSTTTGDHGITLHSVSRPTSPLTPPNAIRAHPASHAGRQTGKITRSSRTCAPWPCSPSRCGGCSAGWRSSDPYGRAARR